MCALTPNTNMQQVYDELISFMLESGKRIASRRGNIKDIGVTKKWLTEEDLAIERGFKEIILKHNPTHEFYAEEENDFLPKSNNVWVSDPISGTKTFINGLPGFAIVIAHIDNGEIVFGAVYDPCADELFTAYKNKGAFLNGKEIFVGTNTISEQSPNQFSLMLNLSSQWKDPAYLETLLPKLAKFKLTRNKNSQALNVCHVACGRYDANLSLLKDSFPMFAASIILCEAGGKFTNLDGKKIYFSDRKFMGGNLDAYKILKDAIK